MALYCLALGILMPKPISWFCSQLAFAILIALLLNLHSHCANLFALTRACPILRRILSESVCCAHMSIQMRKQGGLSGTCDRRAKVLRCWASSVRSSVMTAWRRSIAALRAASTLASRPATPVGVYSSATRSQRNSVQLQGGRAQLEGSKEGATSACMPVRLGITRARKHDSDI